MSNKIYGEKNRLIKYFGRIYRKILKIKFDKNIEKTQTHGGLLELKKTFWKNFG